MLFVCCMYGALRLRRRCCQQELGDFGLRSAAERGLASGSSEAWHETSCRSFKGAEFGPLLRPQLLDAAGLQLEVLVELLQRQATGSYGQLWVTLDGSSARAVSPCVLSHGDGLLRR